MELLKLQNLSKSYIARNGVKTQALQNLTLDLRLGELLAVVGSSGSGKSTLLRLIAGLEKPDSGDILLCGRSILMLNPAERGIAMSFQGEALFDHMTVLQNIQMVAARQPGSKEAAKQTALQLLEQLGLADTPNKHPDELSGGQRQRVELARSFASGCGILLLDEPLSQQDGIHRASLRALIKKLQQEHRVTILYVTHDLREAFALADRVAVLEQGTLLQQDTPQALLQNSADDRVAALLQAGLSGPAAAEETGK